jgi:uncharacterized protein
MSLFDIKPIDEQVYHRKLKSFLPDRMIDVHTHVWLDSMIKHTDKEFERVVSWPSKVAKDNSMEDLAETYELMFPDKSVTPLCFAFPSKQADLKAENDYVARKAKEYGYPALCLSPPDWSGEELERQVSSGRFFGVKVYLNLSPDYIPASEIRIFDFLPHHHLEVLDEHGWIVMLHIPRDGRLSDPVNLHQMMEIEKKYPRVKLIIAHVGRAYCPEDVGDAFTFLRQSERMVFDFSANTNQTVFEELVRCVGPKRVLFGSDLPILRMRMRRICENGRYINIVPKGLYGDVSDDSHMREVEGEAAEKLTFFMYEELLAFKRAAENTGLTDSDLESVFYGNAAELLKSAEFTV